MRQIESYKLISSSFLYIEIGNMATHRFGASYEFNVTTLREIYIRTEKKKLVFHPSRRRNVWKSQHGSWLLEKQVGGKSSFFFIFFWEPCLTITKCRNKTEWLSARLLLRKAEEKPDTFFRKKVKVWFGVQCCLSVHCFALNKTFIQLTTLHCPFAHAN